MLKIVILQKRRAGLSVADFQTHLRDTYGPLAAKGPGLRRYVQSCALPQGYGKGELLFDAIGEMWFDSTQGYETYLGSPQFAAAGRRTKFSRRWPHRGDAGRCACHQGRPHPQ
jgi:uncharacterized protein (TIGR02118 family)